MSDTADCFVGIAEHAGAEAQEYARPLWACVLAFLPSGTRAGSSHPVTIVMLLTEVPETLHLREELRCCACTMENAVELPASTCTNEHDVHRSYNHARHACVAQPISVQMTCQLLNAVTAAVSAGESVVLPALGDTIWAFW